MAGAGFRKVLIRVTVAHLILVLVVVVGHFIGKLKKPPKVHEITTYIDLSEPVVSAPPAVQTPPSPPAPTPPPEPVKPPPPKPKPKKKIEISKKKVKRDTPPPPEPPKRQPVSRDKLRDLLDDNLPKSPQTSRSSAPTSDLSWYLALVRQKMYDAWSQPGELTDRGLRAVVRIRIERNGSVSRKDMIQPSGNSAMDRSIMDAVRSVSRIKPLPSGYQASFKEVEVEFRLTGAVF